MERVVLSQDPKLVQILTGLTPQVEKQDLSSELELLSIDLICTRRSQEVKQQEGLPLLIHNKVVFSLIENGLEM